MGPASYMRSVVDRNVVMRRMPVQVSSAAWNQIPFCPTAQLAVHSLYWAAGYYDSQTAVSVRQFAVLSTLPFVHQQVLFLLEFFVKRVGLTSGVKLLCC